MSATTVFFAIVATLLLAVVAINITNAVENVRIAKHRPCGCDPRGDEAMRREAQRKVQGQ